MADRGFPPASIKMTFPNQVSVETRTDSVVYKSFRLKSNHHKEKVVCEADSNVEEMKRTATKTLKVAYGPEKVVIKGEGACERACAGARLRALLKLSAIKKIM